MKILLGLGLLFFIWKFWESRQTTGEEDDSLYKDVESTAFEQVSVDYSKSYQRKYLLSLNEKSEFKKLVAWASVHDFYVFPKVRLLDIVEPRKGEEHYKSLLWKVQAKHVDFVVCDHECRIKFIIELDDNSHNKKNRAERDQFVDLVLKGVGYSVRRTRGISEEFLESLLNKN